ncbi:MAG TPA: LamB/YcsF family protein, partial [Flavobacteriaceae bacterium]|nr:LamB/YcsF family protein [Flavobacteriaceae bacterium]
PLIKSCNIACGGHSGDIDSMLRCVELAIINNVEIGAHPSYPDKENFGRIHLDIPALALKESIVNQIDSLISICKSHNTDLTHIKAHGALYNEMIRDSNLSNIYLDIIDIYKEKYYLYIPYKSEIEKIAVDRGFKIKYEVFGDRNYNDDLTLVSRKEEEALITIPEKVIKHISEIYYNNCVVSVNGNKKDVKADTYCIHSDTQNAEHILKSIKEYFSNEK